METRPNEADSADYPVSFLAHFFQIQVQAQQEFTPVHYRSIQFAHHHL
jgi:hypothetical protein